MKEVKFSVLCSATYRGSLTLPDEVDSEDTKAVLKYIWEHLEEIPAQELTWLNDAEPCEAVTADDIISIS